MNIGEELSVFWCAVWTGEIVLAGYHMLRWVVRLWYKKRKHRAIEEFLYFTGCGLYIFYCMMNTCDGVIRWYFFAGIGVGGLSEYIILCFLGKAIKNFKKRNGNY